MTATPTYFLKPQYDRLATVEGIYEMIRDTPLSSVVAELEMLERTDYETFCLVDAFFRRAENRKAPGYGLYDREEE